MLLFLSALAGPQVPPSYDPARSFAPLIASVAPAVVKLEEADPSVLSTRTGSGFLVSADGLVLTNHHVVEVFSKIRVRTQDGRTHQAQLLGSDAITDIALLKIDGPTPWLALADAEKIQVGDRVLTLGSPLGLGLTATAGIISGLGRDLSQDRIYGTDDFLQTDASINQGNSGGPLFNLDARVVGMTSAIIDNVNTVGFAIPAPMLAFAIDELTAFGRIRRGYVGVKAAALTAEGAESRHLKGGAVIKEVLADSPAAHAKLKAGDVITRAAGIPIHNHREFMALVGRHKPGAEVPLTVLRRDKVLTLTLSLGELR